MAKKKTDSGALSSTEPAAEVIGEIVEIARTLGEPELTALLNAAHALQTKQKIESFNRELNVAADKAARRRREITAPDYRVSIEETDDGFFVIQLDSARVFFNRAELREITRICHATAAASNPGAAAARRMFKWFEKERSDLLVDAGINSDRNPYLLELYDVVVSTYTVKK